jgi:hypothetical protein
VHVITFKIHTSAASRPKASGRKQRESRIDFAAFTARLKPCPYKDRQLPHRL